MSSSFLQQNQWPVVSTKSCFFLQKQRLTQKIQIFFCVHKKNSHLFAATADMFASEHDAETITKYPRAWQKAVGTLLYPLITLAIMFGMQILATLKWCSKPYKN